MPNYAGRGNSMRVSGAIYVICHRDMEFTHHRARARPGIDEHGVGEIMPCGSVFKRDRIQAPVADDAECYPSQPH